MRNGDILFKEMSKREVLNTKISKREVSKKENIKNVTNFLGFWIRETIDDFIACTMIEFFMEEDVLKAKFYTGTQNFLREINLADLGIAFDFGMQDLFAIPQISNTEIIDVINTEIMDESSVRLFNTQALDYLSSDQLTSTFRISEDIAYMQLWTPWDASGDNKAYGELENLGKFRRLKETPLIQRRDDITNYWDNPVNLFNYYYDTFTHLGQNQRRKKAECSQFIGNKEFAQLKEKLLTKGILRKNKITKEKREGKYIGVWKSINNSGTTTLRLKNRNYFNIFDKVDIQNFKNEYSILNGTHTVCTFVKSSVGPKYGCEWNLSESLINTLHIDFDSSSLPDYCPKKHGLGKLYSFHGPVTEKTEYRDLIVAISDLTSAIGTSTHTSIYGYYNNKINKPVETFSELKEVINSGTFDLINIPFRVYGIGQGSDSLYFNPVLRNTDPIFDINDPSGLYEEIATAEINSKWNIDIDIENYLEISFNIWFAITGPILEDEPITSLLESDYGSNGSQISFLSVKNGEIPSPLKDEYGEHPYNRYQFDENNMFVGGIVNRKYTCKNIAYIRIGNESGFDISLLRSLVFGRKDMPNTKFRSNEIAAMASLLEKLNEYEPSKYILDIRENTGGIGSFCAGWASLFGGNRKSAYAKYYLDYANDPSKYQIITQSIVTGNDSLKYNLKEATTIDTDATAEIFPKSMVRGKEKKIDVVILTNLLAGSAGDIFSHNFIGKNPKKKNYIGKNVWCSIVGSIDGRLYAGQSLMCTPISNPNPYKLSNIYDYPVIPFKYEAGIVLCDDTYETLCNQQEYTQPVTLIPSWYEKQWQDIGYIKPKYKYPLKKKKEKPHINKNETWRDLALEYAITY